MFQSLDEEKRESQAKKKQKKKSAKAKPTTKDKSKVEGKGKGKGKEPQTPQGSVTGKTEKKQKKKQKKVERRDTLCVESKEDIINRESEEEKHRETVGNSGRRSQEITATDAGKASSSFGFPSGVHGLIPTSALLQSATEGLQQQQQQQPHLTQHQSQKQMGSKERRRQSRGSHLSPLEQFQSIRFSLVEQNGFLSYQALVDNLIRHFGPRYRWPDEIQEPVNGMKRILSSIESLIDSSYALHLCLTLHDLQEKMIMSMKDFGEIESFSELKIGRLAKHPRIERMFGLESVSDLITEPPELGTEEVLEYIYEYIGRCPRTEEKPTKEEQIARVHAALDELAIEKGLESAPLLCIFFKAPTFLTFLLSFTGRIKKNIERKFRKNLETYFKTHVEAAFKEESINTIEDSSSFGSRLVEIMKVEGDLGSDGPNHDHNKSLDLYSVFKGVGALLSEEIESMREEGLGWKDLLYSKVAAILTCAYSKVHPSQFDNTLNVIGSRERGYRTVEETLESCRLSLTAEQNEAKGYVLNLLQYLANLESKFWFLLDGAKDTVHASFTSYLVQILNDPDAAEDLKIDIRDTFKAFTWREEKSNLEESSSASAAKEKAVIGGRIKKERGKLVCDHMQSLLNANPCKDLRDLLSLERKLVAERGVADFMELGLGSFIHFCVENQEELIGLPVKSEVITSSNIPKIMNTVSRLLQSISSTGRDPSCETESIAAALDTAFAISNASQLGFTSFESLIENAKQIERSDSIDVEYALTFDIVRGSESATSLSFFDSQVQAEKTAKEGLASAPMLCDLHQWLHWSDLFENYLGGFNSFIKSESHDSSLSVISAGSKFFKYSKFQRGSFEQNLSSGNARMAASCLVGAIVKDGHISVFPINLYSEMCKKALGKYQSDKARTFVFTCLGLAPTVELRVKVFSKVFLLPLIQLVGLESLLSKVSTAEELMILHSCIQVAPNSQITTSIMDALTQGWTPTVQTEEMLVPIQQNTTHRDMSSDFDEGDSTGPKISTLPSSDNVNEKKSQDTVKGSSTYTSSESTTTQNLCLSIREKFGLNKEKRDEKTSQQLSELHGLAMRSIKRLAADLYSQDTHFVLELVQNCDDNRYSSSVTPTLTIVISDSKISFDCNEIGFKVADVYALCNVGSSTKEKGMGYIGHKGIGFKSVFKISDSPEIHSKDFHFGFNKNDSGGLGYIIPNPLSEPEGWDSVAGGTSIRLPLKNQSESALESIRARVSDIHPSLLLFLRQLSCIKVEDHVKSEIKTMKRKVVGDLIELEYRRSVEGESVEETSQNFFVVHKNLHPPVARNKIQQTQISIAMPILGSEEMENFISQQEVYAFLPLRMYGFYFVLQADWELPSSREAVDGSSAWNLWLRDEIPFLFLMLVDQIMDHIKPLYFQTENKGEEEESSDEENDNERKFIQSQEDAIHCLHLLLKMVPLPSQASDFFKPTPSLILQSLKECEFLPSIDCDFCSPLTLVLPPENRAVRKAVSRYLKSYRVMHPSCRISFQLAQALGIRLLEKEMLVEVLQNIARKWNGVSSEDEFELICWVLGKLDNQASAYMSELKALRCIPLTDGSSVSIEISKSIIIMEDLHHGSQSQPPEACMKNSVILNADFCKIARTYEGAMSLMRRLGALQMNGNSFIMNHVIPLMATDDISHEDLATCLSYSYLTLKRMPKFRIHDFVRALQKHDIWLVSEDESESDKVRVSDCRRLLTPAKSDLIPDSLKASKKKIFEYLSSRYNPEAKDKEDWRLLFHMLGVRDTFTISKTEIERDDLGKITDFTCPDLEIILNAVVDSSQLSKQDDSLKRVSENILSHLAKHWDYYSQYSTKQYAVHDSGSKRLPSTWMEQMQNLNWLVGTDSLFHAPSKMFLLNHRSQQLFGGCVPYLDINLSSALYQALGVTIEPDCEAIIDQLCHWSTLPEFSLSKKQMESLYEALSSSNESQIERLRGMRCIFIPNSRPEVITKDKKSERNAFTEESIPGKFFYPQNCILEDKSKLIDSSRYTVTDEMVQMAASSGLRHFSLYYPYTFKKVPTFLLSIGMLWEPSVSHYAKIVKKAASQSPCPDSVATIFRVFCNWGYQLQVSEESSSEESEFHESETFISPQEILSCLPDDLACFPVKTGEWAPYNKVNFYEDKNFRQQLSRIETPDLSREALSACACTTFNGLKDSSDRFKGHEDGAIVIKELRTNLSSFYSKIHIPSLTDCCTREAKTSGRAELMESEHCWFLCVSALVLQCWICKLVGESGGPTETLKAFLQNLQVLEVEELMEEHSISGENFRFLVCDEKVRSFLDFGEKKLYVSNCNQPDLVKISEELASELVTRYTDETLGLKFEKVLNRYLELISHTPEFKWSHETFVDILTRQNLIGADLGIVLHEPWILFQGQTQGNQGSVDLALLQSAASSPLPSSSMVVNDNFDGGAHSLAMDPALAASVKNVRQLQAASITSSATSPSNFPGGLGSTSSPHIRGSITGESTGRRASSSFVNEEVYVSESIDECMLKEWDVFNTANIELPEFHLDFGADLKANLQYAGRQGEEIVARILKETYKGCKMEWVNETVESGNPYDFTVWLTQERKIYIEVKASLASDVPAMIPISFSELQFAEGCRSDYQLWHVAGVLTAIPTVRRLENPAMYFGKGLQLILRA